MFRIAGFVLLVAGLGSLAGDAAGQVPPPRPPVPGPPDAPDLNFDDSPAVLAYVRKSVESVLRDRDPASSLVRQQELERLLARLPTETAAQKNAAAAATKQVQLRREKVYVQTTPLETLLQKVRDNPNDALAVYCLQSRYQNEIQLRFITQPDEAAQYLADLKVVLATVEKAPIGDLTKMQLARAQRVVVSGEQDVTVSLETSKKQREAIGRDALPLVALTWLNGSPLSADDTKGKVLLLDFFTALSLRPGELDEDWPPHVRQLADWQTKYGERGLIVVGLTRYSNLRWDDALQAPQLVRRGEGVVPPAEEQAMLVQVARTQGLKHRLAIQEREQHIKTMMHYPALSQPHLVVIDREGKIRLIRGGASEQFTRDIDQALESLLGAGDAK